MKYFLGKIFTFFIFSFLVYPIVLFFWFKGMPIYLKPNINYRIGSYGHLFTRLKEVKKVKNIDVLFLGSSHTYRGFDPRIFLKNNLNSFNLGSSAQTPIQTKVLLKRYLEKLNPQLVIYEVYPETFMLDGVESALDIVSNDQNDLYSVKMALELKNIKVFNTLIYALSQDLFNNSYIYKEKIKKGRDNYINGGFVEKELCYYENKEKFNSKQITLTPPQLKAFKEVLLMLKSNNTKIVLVYAPIVSSNYLSYKNNDYFDSIMNSYGKYYNFNKGLKCNDSMNFFDSHHLNQNGVVLFNNSLLQFLKKDSIILQKRDSLTNGK